MAWLVEFGRQIACRAASLLIRRGRLEASCNTMSQAPAPSRNEGEGVNRHLVRRNRDLSVLNAIAATVSCSLDLQGILDGALGEILELLKAKVAWVYLKDEQKGCLALAASKGFLAASPQDVIVSVPESCACRQTLDGGTALVVHGGPICLRGSPEVLEQEELKCHASVPLKTKDRVLGIMNLAYSEDRPFAEEELQLLTLIGHQVGMAVENARLYEDLRRKELSGQSLLDKLISAHEEERTRVARELHDGAGQSLTALLLGLGNLEEMLPSDAAEVKRQLAELEALTAGIVEEIRRLMADLRPALLDDLGFIPAIRSFAETQLQRAGVKFEIDVRGPRKKLPSSVEVALFRILQEAITNIAKHAAAKSGTIELCFKESSVAARIKDDGRGFDPVKSRTTWQTFGLLGIEERIAILGGTLRIDSREGQGTQIRLEVPTSPAHG